MDVILRQDVDNLGKSGELVSVKDGYARNFLLPRGLAYLATEGNRRKLEAEKSQRARKDQADVAAARGVAGKLEATSLTFTMKAGEGDKLFGSVTAHDVAERLAAEGFTLDKKQVELAEPIKALGVYKVAVRLHQDVKPEVRVWVVKE
ncbi:MAG: 50S ribosomal protein L9 [Gemmatimonadetes bacterium GWC2_71_10]|nr:MAG: 50S ribosomal protein L9 [Gemmatimonadetes bacterium GWC2_71_10]